MKKKKLLALLLTATMTFSAPLTAFAEGTKKNKEANVNKTNERDYGYEKIIDPIKTQSVNVYPKGGKPEQNISKVVLPTSYSIVDDYTTPLKHQGVYGTCWAHAIMASAENAGILSGADKSAIDYSEMAMAYFMNKECAKDPLNNAVGDKNYRNDGIWVGGNNTGYAAQLLANWAAPINESCAPYENMPAVEYDDEGYIISLDESVSVDTKLAYTNADKHLNAYYLIDTADRDVAKRHLYNNEMLTCSYGSYDGYYDSENNSYYCDMEDCSNHSVAIVGWDDNFSKENFLTTPDGNAPEGDGAWLIRNSWYSYEEDYSEPGDEYCLYGYFWLSYYDASLCEIKAYEYESTDDYDNNYYYDGGYCSNEIEMPTKVKVANVFKTKANKKGELLKAAGILTYNTNVKYTIDIYLNPTDGNPESGYKVEEATTKGTLREAGYKIIDLDSEVELAYGDTYAVVVTYEKYGDIVKTAVEYNWMIDYPDYWYTSEVSIKENQSYVCIPDEGWYDLYDFSYGGRSGNVRIKAFTENSDKQITRTYPINYELNGGVNDADNPYYYSTDEEVMLLPAYKDGYTFKGWYLDPEFKKSIKSSASVSGEITVYAKWQANKYSITYALNGGKNSKDNPVTYKTNSKTITFKPATRKGYIFKGWYLDKKLTKQIKSIKSGTHKNIKVYAKWSPIAYSIKFDACGGTGKMNALKATYGKTVTLKKCKLTKTGYKFAGWAVSKSAAKAGRVKYKDGAKVKNLAATNGKAVTLYAVWKAK